jgi:hypothetical protein
VLFGVSQKPPGPWLTGRFESPARSRAPRGSAVAAASVRRGRSQAGRRVRPRRGQTEASPDCPLIPGKVCGPGRKTASEYRAPGAGPEFGGGGRSVTGRSWSVMSRSATHDATPTPEVSCDSGRGLPSGSSSRGGIYCSTARLVVRKLEMAGTAIDFAVGYDRRTCPHGWLSLLNGCSSGLWGRPTVTHRPGHVPAGGDHTRRCRRAGRDATRVRWCWQPGRCQEQGRGGRHSRGGRRRWRRGK